MGQGRLEKFGTKITKQCLQCGEQFITTTKRETKFCGRDCSHTYKRKSHSQFVAELIEIYSGMIVPLEIYKGADSEIDYKCLKCGSIGRKKAGRFLGKYKRGCGNCSNGSKNSKGSQEIERFLEERNMEYEKEYRFNGLRMKSSLLYDFAVLKNGLVELLIEYDGRQHFEPIDEWGGEAELERTKESDSLKNQYAIDNNIPLIRIKYDCEDITSELEEKLKEIM